MADRPNSAIVAKAGVVQPAAAAAEVGAPPAAEPRETPDLSPQALGGEPRAAQAAASDPAFDAPTTTAMEPPAPRLRGAADVAQQAADKRLRAGTLMLAGHTPAQAAAAVGVARQTAYTWKRRLDKGGMEALEAMTPGRPSRLDARQLQALRDALLGSARDHGFDADGWTPLRVQRLIEQRWGVHFSVVHIGRLIASHAPALRRARRGRRGRGRVTSSARARGSRRCGGSTGPRR